MEAMGGNIHLHSRSDFVLSDSFGALWHCRGTKSVDIAVSRWKFGWKKLDLVSLTVLGCSSPRVHVNSVRGGKSTQRLLYNLDCIFGQRHELRYLAWIVRTTTDYWQGDDATRGATRNHLPLDVDWDIFVHFCRGSHEYVLQSERNQYKISRRSHFFARQGLDHYFGINVGRSCALHDCHNAQWSLSKLMALALHHQAIEESLSLCFWVATAWRICHNCGNCSQILGHFRICSSWWRYAIGKNGFLCVNTSLWGTLTWNILLVFLLSLKSFPAWAMHTLVSGGLSLMAYFAWDNNNDRPSI